MLSIMTLQCLRGIQASACLSSPTSSSNGPGVFIKGSPSFLFVFISAASFRTSQWRRRRRRRGWWWVLFELQMRNCNIVPLRVWDDGRKCDFCIVVRTLCCFDFLWCCSWVFSFSSSSWLSIRGWWCWNSEDVVSLGSLLCAKLFHSDWILYCCIHWWLIKPKDFQKNVPCFFISFVMNHTVKKSTSHQKREKRKMEQRERKSDNRKMERKVHDPTKIRQAI